MKKIRVTVAFAGPASAAEISLEIDGGTTIAGVLKTSHERLPLWLQSVLNEKSNLDSSGFAVGVWGKVRPDSHELRDGDRVEIYRALQADPKDARRAKVEAAESAGRRKAKC